MLLTKSCECFQHSLLHGASQFPPLCLHLPLFPSRMCRAQEDLYIHFLTKQLAWCHELTCRVLGIRCVPKVL
jgi:hypothetical protein